MPRETKHRIERNDAAMPQAAAPQNCKVEEIRFRNRALLDAAPDGKTLYLCLFGNMLCMAIDKDDLREAYNNVIHKIIIEMYNKGVPRFDCADYDIDEVWFARKQIVIDGCADDFEWWRFTHNYYLVKDSVGATCIEVPESQYWTNIQKEQWYIWDRHLYFCLHTKKGETYTQPDLKMEELARQINPNQVRPAYFYRKRFEFVDGSVYEDLRQKVDDLPVGWKLQYPKKWGNPKTEWVEEEPNEKRIEVEKESEWESKMRFIVLENKKKAFFTKYVKGVLPPPDLTTGAKTLWKYLSSSNATSLLRLDTPRAIKDTGMPLAEVEAARVELRKRGFYYEKVLDDAKLHSFFIDFKPTDEEWEDYLLETYGGNYV